MNPESDERLNAVLIGGREESPIIIVEYDPGWPSRFDALALKIKVTVEDVADKDVHIHSFSADNPAVPNYLDLGDWLRVDEKVRELYVATKNGPAQQQWADMNYYEGCHLRDSFPRPHMALHLIDRGGRFLFRDCDEWKLRCGRSAWKIGVGGFAQGVF